MRTTLFITLLILFFTKTESQAQVQAMAYTDFGKNQSAERGFLRTAIQGRYLYNKTAFEASIQNSIIGINEKFISGIYADLGHKFKIKTFDFSIHGLYYWNSPGEIIRENNWATYLQIKRAKLNLKLGTHFRNLYYSNKALANYTLTSQESINEYWNTIYSIEFFINRQDSKWNIGFCATNMDHFLFNQETNPLFNINANYRFKESYKLFVEGWYKSSGSLNASVHYFGYLIRTGLQWELKSK